MPHRGTEHSEFLRGGGARPVGDVCSLEVMAEARVTAGEGWRFAGEPRQETVGAGLTGLRERPQRLTGAASPFPSY